MAVNAGRVIVVVFYGDRPTITITAAPGAILGRPKSVTEHIETELALRVPGWVDVECGKIEVGDTGVGCLRSGAKGDNVEPFRWAWVDVNLAPEGR